jgi:tight adherence protein B
MPSSVAGAALLGGLAVAAALGGSPERLVEQRLGEASGGRRSGAATGLRRAARNGGGSPTSRSRQLGLAVGALIVLSAWIDVRLLVPSVLLYAGAMGAAMVRSRMAARAQAARRRAMTVETCDQLAAELSAGQAPPRALQHAADTWHDLSPVAAAARLGSDVPASWRMVAELPGAEALRSVAAAWQVAEQSGAGLAVVLERMSGVLRAEDAVRREVDAALGPPRATARMLAALPAFGLLLGIGMGGDPIGFLLTTPLGAGCLVIGCAFAVTGVWWVDRLARAAQR